MSAPFFLGRSRGEHWWLRFRLPRPHKSNPGPFPTRSRGSESAEVSLFRTKKNNVALSRVRQGHHSQHWPVNFDHPPGGARLDASHNAVSGQRTVVRRVRQVRLMQRRSSVSIRPQNQRAGSLFAERHDPKHPCRMIQSRRSTRSQDSGP